MMHTDIKSVAMTTAGIGDTITGRSVTCEPHHIAEELAEWFPDAPADVRDALAGLQSAVCAAQPSADYEAYAVAAVAAGAVMGLVALAVHGWHIYQRHRAQKPGSPGSSR
jgi:hypothetical protein